MNYYLRIITLSFIVTLIILLVCSYISLVVIKRKFNKELKYNKVWKYMIIGGILLSSLILVISIYKFDIEKLLSYRLEDGESLMIITMLKVIISVIFFITSTAVCLIMFSLKSFCDLKSLIFNKLIAIGFYIIILYCIFILWFI